MSTSYPDPDYLPAVLAKLPDRAVLERLERAFEAVTYVNDERLVSPMDPRQHPALWQNLVAAWNEAYGRGYTEQDVSQAIVALAQERGFLRRLGEQTGRHPKSEPAWRRFERMVANIHRLTGPDCVVTHNDSLFDRTTGTGRQIDVTVRFKKGLYEFVVVIECRDQQTNISIDDVDGFAQKLADVRGNKGVLVTTSGFADSAKQKAAFHGIEVFTADEAVQVDWQPHIRQIVSNVPFPKNVTFVPLIEGTRVEGPVGYYADLSFVEFILEDSEGRRVDDLARLIWKLGLQVTKDQIPLPGRIRAELDPPMVLCIDRFAMRTPLLRAIEVTLVRETISRRVQVENPAFVHRVRYRNARTGDERDFILAPEPCPAEDSIAIDPAQLFELKLRELESLIRAPLRVKEINPLVLTTSDSDFRFEGSWPPDQPCADERPLAVGDTVFLTGLVIPTGQISYTAPCGCMYSTHGMVL